MMPSISRARNREPRPAGWAPATGGGWSETGKASAPYGFWPDGGGGGGAEPYGV